MGAFVLCKIPDPDVATSVTAYELALVWMNHNIVDRNSVAVVSLDVPSAGIPDLDGAILGAGHHPFAFAMKGQASNVVCVTFKSQNRGRVCGFDVI